MNRPWRALVPGLWCCAVWASGCQGSATPADAQAGAEVVVLPDGAVLDPALDVGTGQSLWEPLSPTASTNVELIHGTQGGYHVFGRVRFSALPADVYVWFRVTEPGSAAPINDPGDRIRLRATRGLLRTEQGWESSNALLVILTTVHDPAAVVGRTFTLEADLQAASEDGGVGPVLTVRRTVRVVDEQ